MVCNMGYWLVCVFLLWRQALGQGFDPFGGDHYEEEYYEQAGPGFRGHIDGIVDTDWLTFDKVALSGRPTFVTFYDGSQPDVAGVEWMLSGAAAALGNHMRLLMAKMDVSQGDNLRIFERFGAQEPPLFVLLDGPASQTQFVGDSSTSTPDEDLVAWLIEQVRSFSRSSD